MNYVTISNGETIAYNDKGTGSNVLVAIHGNMSSSVHLDVLYDAYPDNLRIITPDMRGFGESSYNNQVNSLEEYANDIIELIDKLGLDEFSLLGWSTGGGVAMTIAAKLKNRVKKLVLVASVGIAGYPVPRMLENGQLSTDEFLTTREELESDTFRTVAIQKAFDSNDREFIRTVWDSAIYTHNKPEPEVYERYITDVLTQKSIVDVYYSLLTFNISDGFNGATQGNNKVSDITADTLIIQGERDYVVPMAMAESIKNGLKTDVRMETGDFGHSPFVDCPEWVVDKIVSFISC